MGWNSISEVYLSGKGAEDIKEFFVKEYNREQYFELLDYSKKGNTIYMAVEKLKTNEVFAVVILISFSDGEFFWKEMDETVGPVQAECPQRILKKLTPTNYEYALKWREKCWEFHANNNSKKYQHGQVLKFPNIIEFTNGFKGDEFILIKEGRRCLFSPYRGQADTRGLYGQYQISKWRQREPEIVKTLA